MSGKVERGCFLSREKFYETFAMEVVVVIGS